MQTINTFYGICVDISEERIRDYRRDLKGYRSLAQKLEEFAKLDVQYLRRFLSLRGYTGSSLNVRMLEAHGGPLDVYSYADLENEELVWHSVEEWLGKYDGNYDLLYLSCCNPRRHIIEAKKSTIVYPLDKIQGNAIALEVLNGIKSSFIISFN